MVDRPQAPPLQLLTEAVIMAGRLGELSDDLVDHFVQKARQAGATWAEIGQSIGVSKQAAQKRFVRSPRSGFRGAKRGLFTRFAAGARSAVRAAVASAHEYGSEEVGTIHVLLGLLYHSEGVAARAIADLADVPIEELRAEAVSLLGEGSEPHHEGHIRFAPESKKALELSLREAIRGESRHIGSEHVLLGVLRDKSSGAAGLLSGHGVTHERVAAWLAEH